MRLTQAALVIADIGVLAFSLAIFAGLLALAMDRRR